MYGNRWLCDAPAVLVDSLPQFNMVGKPDFIIWTGDNSRHDSDPLIPRTANDIYTANSVVASVLKQIGVPLVPSIGNNDVYPHDQLCMGPSDPNLGNLSLIWSPFIPYSQMNTFKQLGSYVSSVTEQISVVSLNSMAMFKRNRCGSGCHSGQPGEQVLNWLHDVLQSASAAGKTIYISGHIPPTTDFWHNKCLERYSALVTTYGSIIAGHIYAHTHQDNFAILKDPSTGNPNGVVTIAPSVLSTYNPSIRQFLYDEQSGFLTDYVQFYANLTQSNDQRRISWQAEYSWRKAYGYTTWTLPNWVNLDSRISSNPWTTALYLKYRYVSSGLSQFLCSPTQAASGACVVHPDKHHPRP